VIFKDRKEAGQKLAPLLEKYKKTPNGLVIGLPRGGVVVASEVAKALELPLDVVSPRKVGAPHNPELALGAITHTGAGYFNQDIIFSLGVSDKFIAAQVEQEKRVAAARQKMYRKNRPLLEVKDKVCILVDDGLATGATMKACIQWVKEEKASFIIVAIPVSPPDTLEEVRAMCNEVVCLSAPAFFQAVGQFYEDFRQTSDEEVIELLLQQPN
jgi:putative phosphoribosyl transferase